MEDKQHYTEHRKRLFEKFDNNPDMIFDYELIEMLLFYSNMRKDMKPLSKEIIRMYPNLINLLSEDLSHIDGVGESTVRLFYVIKELYSRMQKTELKSGTAYSTPEQVYKFLQYSIGYSSIENIAVILLNSKNKLITYKIMSQGVVDAALLLPRQVADFAIKQNASGVILAHNHPSNDPTPSSPDKYVTTQVKKALDTLGVAFIDHVIVCKTKFCSFKAVKLL